MINGVGILLDVNGVDNRTRFPIWRNSLLGMDLQQILTDCCFTLILYVTLSP